MLSKIPTHLANQTHLLIYVHKTAALGILLQLCIFFNKML